MKIYKIYTYKYIVINTCKYIFNCKCYLQEGIITGPTHPNMMIRITDT